MNNLFLFLAYTWSAQSTISMIMLFIIGMFFLLVYWVFFPNQRNKVEFYKNFGKKSLPVDFPEPLVVEVFRPDPERDPNRMIWHISKDDVSDGLSMRLQKYLEAKLNHGLNLSVKVYDLPNKEGIWINFRKLKAEKKEWEEIIISAEEHLRLFFERNIEFHRKKDEVVAST